MKKINIIGALCALFMLPSLSANAEDSQTPLSDMFKPEFAVCAGSTGLEFEVGSQITQWARIRTGFQFMPDFTLPMDFTMTAVDGSAVSSPNFDRIQETVRDLTGYDVDQKVRMHCNPTFYNFKLMADFYPFSEQESAVRNIRLTAGFYLGTERVGKAVNAIEEMPSLLMVGLYNRLYSKVTDPTFIDWVLDTPIYENGNQVIYLDPNAAEVLQEKLRAMGRLGMLCGHYPDGTPYIMEPGDDGTVRANAYVNRFKPYFGLGMDQAITADRKVNVGFDMGAMFWGGTPRVITHDGVELNQMRDLPNQIENKMKLMRKFPVYPVLNLRLSYKF